MALIMYFSIGNAYKINRFYATASSACKQLAINSYVDTRDSVINLTIVITNYYQSGYYEHLSPL